MTTTRAEADQVKGILEKVAEAQSDVWPSKFEVVDEDGVFKLLHYAPLTEQKYRTPILIVYAWINRPYVLDMETDISVVRKYLNAGFDVYMTDWGYPGRVDRHLTLDDYVNFLDSSIETTKMRNNVDNVTLHGYCLGGTLSSVYTTLFQDNVRNLLLQATPIDFNTNNTINLWSRKLDVDKLVDAFGVAPGQFLNIGFIMVNPINLIAGKYKGLLDMIGSKEETSSFLRMDRFIFDSPNIPGETYRQYITEWYKKNTLIKGEFKALGQTIDLGKIEVPLLVLAATYDHIAPPESQKAIMNLVSSQDKEVYEMNKGHIGITTSRSSHKTFWPKVIEWIKVRSEAI
ncbi:MAG: alpha/beta fold hydrolase [Chloroflexi bacterium]|nr:alpha/beta fold hydrolase [Chloroflexota bacterium]